MKVLGDIAGSQWNIELTACQDQVERRSSSSTFDHKKIKKEHFIKPSIRWDIQEKITKG